MLRPGYALRMLTFGLPLAALTLATAEARADDADETHTETLARPPAPPPSMAPFGARGQLAFDDLLGWRAFAVGALGTTYSMTGMVGFSVVSTKGAAQSGEVESDENVFFAPSIDYFVVDRLSVGGLLEASYLHQHFEPGANNTDTFLVARDVSATRLGIRPRVGYVLPLSDELALWPRVSAGYAVTHGGAADGSTDDHAVRADLELLLVARLGRHAFLDIGPTFGVESVTASGPHGFDRTSVGGGARASLGLAL